MWHRVSGDVHEYDSEPNVASNGLRDGSMPFKSAKEGTLEAGCYVMVVQV